MGGFFYTVLTGVKARPRVSEKRPLFEPKARRFCLARLWRDGGGRAMPLREIIFGNGSTGLNK